MSSSVICIESDDDDVCIVQGQAEVIVLDDSQKNGSATTLELSSSGNGLEDQPGPSSSSKTPPLRRIKPTLVSKEVTSPSKKKVFGGENSNGSPEKGVKRRTGAGGRPKKGGSFKRTRLMKLSDNLEISDVSDEEESKPSTEVVKKEGAEEMKISPSKEKFTKEFRKLILTCQSVDTSVDMEKLIRKKLIGYYREVPTEFVNSKSFKDVVAGVTEEVKKSPHLIYLKITRIIEELKPRRISIANKQQQQQLIKKEANTEESAVTAAVQGEGDNEQQEQQQRIGNAKKDAQIRKLNKALVKLKKRIDELDKEEVDWDQDINSAHMKVERYKKRACQIYEKLCEISGESKHAQRSARKPIKFYGTVYPEFNKTLQAFVNRTNIFPDFFDVKKCLEHCDKLYNMRLRPEEIKTIAQDAFIKVGKILQKRRKMDLYEMVSYFVGTDGDPADEDSELQDKLGQNKQYHTKISDLIDKFADDQTKNGQNDEDDVGVSEGEVDREVTDRDNTEPEMKLDPSSILEARMSVEGDEVPEEVLNSSDDLFKDAPTPQPSNTSIAASAVPVNNGAETEVNEPDPSNLLIDSVNMDEAIQYMVSNSVNPFETMPEVDVLMQEFPID